MNYNGTRENKKEFGMAFIVSNRESSREIYFKAISERICKIRINSEPNNIAIIPAHTSTKDSIKLEFYRQLKQIYDQSPKFDMAQIGNENYFSSAVGKCNTQDESNSSGVK